MAYTRMPFRRDTPALRDLTSLRRSPGAGPQAPAPAGSSPDAADVQMQEMQQGASTLASDRQQLEVALTSLFGPPQ